MSTGCFPDLDAVPTEPDAQAADRIVLTGGVVAGPRLADASDRGLVGDTVVWVRGNGNAIHPQRHAAMGESAEGVPPQVQNPRVGTPTCRL